MSLDDHAEELASDLGVDKEEVKEDLEKLVQYSVPIDEAKGSLRRKYGDDGSGGGEATAKDIVDISPDDSSVTVTARVLTHGKRSIRYEGEDQTIFEGELADETGVVSYTAWQDFGLSPGDTITAGNAGVREWEGDPELNLGESTTLVFEDEDLDVSEKIGGDRDLADLEPGDRGRNVEIVVQELERKTIDGRDGETEIWSGVVADKSARLPFTDWDPNDLNEGGSYRFEDVYVREFRGVPSVNLTEFSHVEPLDSEVEATDAAQELSVGEAVASGGAFDIEVVGNLIEVRDGSGLIERCPECGRVVQNGQCRSHGDVDGVDDLRVKGILDDGTGTLTVVLDDQLTAEVYGGGVEKAKEHARDAMDKEVVMEAIAEKLEGREFRVRGQLSVDEYGANLDAETFEETDDDPANRAAAFLTEVGG